MKAFWIAGLHWLDYALALPLLARLPLSLGYRLAALRGQLNARVGRDWRSVALGTRHVTRQATLAYRELFAEADAAAIKALVDARYRNESREEFEGRLIAAHRVHELHPEFGNDPLLQQCREAARAGRGVVLLTPHFESFVLGIVFLARAGIRLNAMSSRVTHDPAVAPAVSRHFVAKYRGMEHYLNGGQVVDRELGLRPFYKMLERGEGLVILADAPAVAGGVTITPQFLGGARPLSGGALRLAQRTDSLFGAFVCKYAGRQRYRLEGTALLPARQPEALAAAYDFLAAQIMAHPGGWWASDILPLAPLAEPRQ